MEVLSLHSEVMGEGGERFRICYRLMEQPCGAETAYGILSYIEGTWCRPDQRCWLPTLFASRWLGTAAVELLASAGVMPVHIEEILQESLI